VHIVVCVCFVSKKKPRRHRRRGQECVLDVMCSRAISHAGPQARQCRGMVRVMVPLPQHHSSRYPISPVAQLSNQGRSVEIGRKTSGELCVGEFTAVDTS